MKQQVNHTVPNAPRKENMRPYLPREAARRNLMPLFRRAMKPTSCPRRRV